MKSAILWTLPLLAWACTSAPAPSARDAERALRELCERYEPADTQVDQVVAEVCTRLPEGSAGAGGAQ